ncbi:hypothetical protein GEV33_004911 [Tenebrio molitor]|uniref:F-box domain-containing protein n=1 Tax=Tenebrio molitor TaxID=7067 RepID=A0A8J6LE57_TENMO|nr:hypothetical protein GEV33_004911 [Tenebrio molitor]
MRVPSNGCTCNLVVDRLFYGRWIDTVEVGCRSVGGVVGVVCNLNGRSRTGGRSCGWNALAKDVCISSPATVLLECTFVSSAQQKGSFSTLFACTNMIYAGRNKLELTKVLSDDEALINKKLPKELLLRIFSYIDVVSLCRCAQVSKAWNVLALDGSNWQRIDLFDFQKDVEGPIIENISRRCGGFLRQLSLRGCQSIADGSMKTLAQLCPNVEDLNLNGCKKLTDASCTAFSKHCSKLQKLNLDSCSAITDNSLKALSDGCPNLTHINISWCSNITENGVEALARGCRKLKSFISKGCKQITSRAVICLGRFCDQLEVVNLLGCSNIRDEAVQALAEMCPRLHYLCLSGCSALTDASLIALAQKCTLLSTLEVAGCSQFTDAAFQALARSCRYLEKMDLDECVLITDNTLIHLAMGCPRIEYLVSITVVASFLLI